MKSSNGFDSIDDDNRLSFGKSRNFTWKHVIVIVVVSSVLFFVVGILIGHFAIDSQETGADGGCAAAQGTKAEDKLDDVQKFILDNVDKERIRSTLQSYTSEPRLAGTPKDYELGLQIEREWKANGLDEVHLATYDVRLSFPNATNPNVIQLISTSNGTVLFESHKYEVPLRENENNSNLVPPFNGYSPAGDVSGKMVYVNYGTIEDFEFLTNNLSLSVNGCIAISRYGRIYRGDKVKNAERFGALGLILFSDPADYNLNGGVRFNETYPSTWWLPPSGIQRGTVGYDDGDVDTPLYPSTYYAQRLPKAKVDEVMPRIPIQPIGYNDAEILLRKMGGKPVPGDWQGGLPFQYHLGPDLIDSNLVVRVNVNNYQDVGPATNVIGYITGSEEPDRYIFLGNHHDAWTFGAMDPMSGSAAITELTRVFGLLLKNGHRPKRTIVFCSWDAEEYGLLGSMEWAEDHLKLLLQRGVAYLNLDYSAAANFTVAVGTSPLLQDVMYSMAKKVAAIDPTWTTLYDQWKARPRVEGTPPPEPYLVYSLGSGSDMATFYQRAGVPSVDMWVTYDEINVYDYPLYHTSYDTFYAYETFVDPGFHANRAITQFLGILTAELAWSELIPMKVERYSHAISGFRDTLFDQFETTWLRNGVNTVAFSSAVQNFTAATRKFQQHLDDNIDTIKQSPLAVRRVNDQLIFLERAFLDPQGLPGRPAQKHVVFAPSQFDAYVDNNFPGIVDTMWEIERGADLWDQLRHQVYVATYIIQSAAGTLETVGL